jgi:hypothetical protein
MPQLAAELKVQANLDLTDLFGSLATEVLGVDFGDVSFDASGVLGLVSGTGGVDLSALRASVSGTLASGTGRLELGLPGVTVAPALLDLVTRLGSLQTILPDVTVPDLVGLPGLSLRVDAVRGAVETGPLADLLALVPGLEWPDLLGRLGGDLGGFVDLLRILAGLTAMATASRHLVERTERFVGLLDREAALGSATLVTQLSGDLDLVASIRNADPTDAATVELLAVRVAAFVDGVLQMGEIWSAGMGYGEAALPFLDITGTAAAIELARLALTGADADTVTQLVAEIRRAGAPLLDVPVPDAGLFADGFVAQATELATSLTTAVEAWDVTAALHPITDVTALALAPITQFQQALSGVENEVTGALHSLRGLVDELDLTPLATAVQDTLQPVTELLDAVTAEIGSAEATLTEVAGNITSALDMVAGLVLDASGTVTGALTTVSGTLEQLHLQDLADALSSALRTVAATLASAQLSPYFDAAIDVISTCADVIDAVPFGMLPTDIQQEIVDACKPIKALDLQGVEDALRAELATIQDEFKADALAAIEAAYAEVVAFLASMDPVPLLTTFETDTLSQVRATLDAIDPEALLEPVASALGEVRGLLDGFDLEREVMEPLRGLFQPILDAIDGLDPAQLLAPVQTQVNQLRTSLTDVLHLDAAEEALTSFKELVTEWLARIDPVAVAEVLDDRAIAAIAALPDGPPGGAFGSLLVSLAEASGLRADEPAVQDVINWVRGVEIGGDVVRGRIQLSAAHLASVRETVATLDPAPVAVAAAAYHRALSDAVATHPADSLLRTTLEPTLSGSSPAQVLGTLAENRRRYQIGLDADATVVGVLGASGRSEVTEAAAKLNVALAPLGAFPAKLRSLLDAVGLDPEGRTFRAVLLDLLSAAGPGGLTPALISLVAAARDKVVEALDVVVGSGISAIDSVQALLALLDLAPILDELTALQTQVHDEVAQLTPEALLGEVVHSADAVIDRLQAFDPLAPVRQVITSAKQAADSVFESARPIIVFAPVIELHQQVVGIASGLDVVSLLRPVLDALDGIAAQLDTGLDKTGDALKELQDALPSEVSSNPVSASASVDIGVSF